MVLTIQERLKNLRVERGLTPVSYTHLLSQREDSGLCIF